jgi:hypothetical protein
VCGPEPRRYEVNARPDGWRIRNASSKLRDELVPRGENPTSSNVRAAAIFGPAGDDPDEPPHPDVAAAARRAATATARRIRPRIVRAYAERVRSVTTILALLAATAPPYPPTPIGRGPEFLPPAAPPAVRRGLPVGDLRCTAGGTRFGIHLELFARGRVVVVPSGIGVASPFSRDGAYVVARGCTYPIRTRAPTGVVEVVRGRPLRLGDLFAVWGQPLAPTRLASFTTSARRPVRAYVGGRRWRGPVREIPLSRHAQIVLQVGAYIRPHARFVFPPAL